VGALTDAASPLARDVVLYLVDFEQEILQPFVDGSGSQVLIEEPLASTLAGRAYSTGDHVVAERPDGLRLWVPVFEHSVRTGVLALTVDAATPAVTDHCRSLGMLAGLLVASAARYTDLVHVRKRARSMTLAASMQWDLLPPLTLRADRVVVAGLLEPAYQVAGDGFDHSINGDRVDVAVFDGMGHGIASTLLTTLAIGTYRHQRRDGRDLASMHDTIDSVMADHFPDAFVTGLLTRVNTTTGLLELTNAGHPSPLLLRNRRIVGEIVSEPVTPFGLGSRCEQVAEVALEPGDTVVLYTDGIVEGRTRGDGGEFGVARLGDFLEREAASGRPAEEILRRLVRAVLEHQDGNLRDDATIVLLHWDGPPREIIPAQTSLTED